LLQRRNVTLGYDQSGRLASIAYPNGVTTAYGYDAKGRLNALSHTSGANPSFGYTYNPVGNILAILDQVNPAENRTHTYDALQRLKTGGTTGTAESYNYDLVGNRTTSFLSSVHPHP
jgi:YD repeat-containing protein